MNLTDTVYKLPGIEEYDKKHGNVQQIIDEVGLAYAFELLDAIQDPERKGRKVVATNDLLTIGSPTFVFEP